MDRDKSLKLIDEAIELLCDFSHYTSNCSKCEVIEVCTSLCNARNILRYGKEINAATDSSESENKED